VYLSSKDTSDHNGIESYIHAKYEGKDIAWIPRMNALCLNNAGGEDEDEDDSEFLLRKNMQQW